MKQICRLFKLTHSKERIMPNVLSRKWVLPGFFLIGIRWSSHYLPDIW
jgi:hypothetical protein